MKKNHITSNIKLLRLHAGLSQNDFAKLFNVSRDNVASYERGSEPRVSFLNDLVNYFHITFEDLINNELNFTFLETKCVQNVVNSNDHNNDHENDHKRNVQETWSNERNPRDVEMIELQKKHITLMEQQMASMAEQIADLKKELEELSGFVVSETSCPAASFAATLTDNPKGGDNPRLNRP